MNNYTLNQVAKAIQKNNGNLPKYVDIYNGNPITDDICITLTTSSGTLGGCGSVAIITERERK